MNPRIRLLAIDIDGTLLNSQWEVSEANRDAIAAAAKRGVEIVLVTGRRFTFARPIAERLPVPWTLISSGGAVLKTPEGETLYRKLLPAAVAREVLKAAEPHRRAALLIFDKEEQGQIVTENHNPWHEPVNGYLDRSRKYLLEVPRLEEALNGEDPIQVLFAGPVDLLREIFALLEKASCRPRIHLARTEYPERDFAMLDVLDAACNKGTALAAWATEHSIAADEVMALGDNWNDLEMLEFAGLPVLMGNSSEALKQKGWAVTTGNNEDGVARAIERYVLTEE